MKDALVVLASASPRRQELLKLLQIPFEVLSSPVPEVARVEESPQLMVQRLAHAKVAAVQFMRPQSIIIAADTVVVCQGQILGKPHSQEAAREMLKRLSGRTHDVLTGICVLYRESYEVEVSQTAVQFSPLSDQEIETYLGTGEPLDKAGGYAIQGLGSRFIRRIDGCFFNVVGLPISLLYQMLVRRGYPFYG